MPVAQGNCPSCGAEIRFGLGSSLSVICGYCNATVVRTDRGLSNLGKVADIADTPSLIAVGDQGTLAGRPFEVLGRLQLDYGLGPWDEYYVAFDHGAAWGWLAYAQGRWHVTSAVPGVSLPPYGELRLEQDVPLGAVGVFRVAEINQASVRSAEGELPGADPPGTVFYYADCYGKNGQFATFDYEDGRRAPTLYSGYVFAENQLRVTALGPRSAHRVKTTHLQCPNCGGDVPKLSGDRAERLGCPYCGAVSDITERRVIAQQERLLQMPDVPVGGRGRFEDQEYLCLAYLRRSSEFDSERYGWEEYLLFAESVGYRWLIKDPETGWSFASAVSPADLDLRLAPGRVGLGTRSYRLRNENTVRVDYVLGEVYWKCAVGETVLSRDYISGNRGLSREQTRNEVNWSSWAPIEWALVAAAFDLQLDGPGSRWPGPTSGGGADFDEIAPGQAGKAIVLLIMLVVMIFLGSLQGGGVFVSAGSGLRGGGVYFGGK